MREKIIDAEFEEINTIPTRENKSIYRDAIFFMAWMSICFISGALFCMAYLLL